LPNNDSSTSVLPTKHSPGPAAALDSRTNYGDGADNLQGGNDADIVKLSGFDFDDATRTTKSHDDRVTLTKSATDAFVSVNWQRGGATPQTLTFVTTEQVQLDVSAGSDTITVHDLRGSSLVRRRHECGG
jgi:hypothetical protein